MSIFILICKGILFLLLIFDQVNIILRNLVIYHMQVNRPFHNWSASKYPHKLTCGQLARIRSRSSSEKSPWTTISSWFWLFLATEDPQAKRLANIFAAFLSSTSIMHVRNNKSSIYTYTTKNCLPNTSRPWIVVTHFRFVLSTRLMITCDSIFFLFSFSSLASNWADLSLTCDRSFFFSSGASSSLIPSTPFSTAVFLIWLVRQARPNHSWMMPLSLSPSVSYIWL